MVTPSCPTSGITPHMTYGALRRLAERLGLDVSSDLIPGDMDGYYIASCNRIVIDRRLSYRAKRCALVHEMVHATHHDACRENCIGARIERRCRRETAMILIDEDEYRTAEGEYEGEMIPMCAALDVTAQVMRDYRELILEPMRSRVVVD